MGDYFDTQLTNPIIRRLIFEGWQRGSDWVTRSSLIQALMRDKEGARLIDEVWKGYQQKKRNQGASPAGSREKSVGNIFGWFSVDDMNCDIDRRAVEYVQRGL